MGYRGDPQAAFEPYHRRTIELVRSTRMALALVLKVVIA
jgi:hypothetical protein